jgi:hypothetical protein
LKFGPVQAVETAQGDGPFEDIQDVLKKKFTAW